MHLASVAELLFRGRRRGSLNELSEAGSRIGETPGWQFNTESFEGVKDFLR
jgi:hypothetical protein